MHKPIAYHPDLIKLPDPAFYALQSQPPLASPSVLIMYLPIIPNQLQAAEHLTDGEEAQEFRNHNATSHQRRPIETAQPAKDGFWRGRLGRRS